MAKIAKIQRLIRGAPMPQSMSAKDAKYGFGRLIDLARLEPIVIEKHGRPVVVVLAIEEYERLRGGIGAPSGTTSAAVVKQKRKGADLS